MNLKRIMATVLVSFTMIVGSSGSIANASNNQARNVAFYASKWYDTTNQYYYIDTQTTTKAYFFSVYTTGTQYLYGYASYNWDVEAEDSWNTEYHLSFKMTSGSFVGNSYMVRYYRNDDCLALTHYYYR